MRNVRLGAFELDRPLGEGGMGSVWAAHHIEGGLPVAVKVVHELSDKLRAVFRLEVEAVAALDHPGIVMVYDHGEVSEEASAASGGRLIAGSPWLVMEHASGGTLEHSPAPRSWNGLRHRLLSILDALAHAHARGVVHRDLKPANVLVCKAPDLRPGIKLADFGLALALDGRAVLAAGAGTPAYMAPEQVLGHWWDFGPWTDLYALGGMAWELVTSERAFPGEEPRTVGRAQVNAPLPAYTPAISVPAAFEEWLRALLEKTPARRPDSAAWCAAELLAMGAPDVGGTPGLASHRGAAPTVGLFTLIPAAPGTEDLEDEPDLTSLDPQVVRSNPGGTRIRTRQRLDPGKEWRQHEAVRPRGLTRAGLGLFGVRPPPMEGRHTERQKLWSLLRLVSNTRVPHLALIRGTEGLGASRLAQWIGERGTEVGAARVLKITQSGPLPGLPGLVEQVVRLRDVPTEIAERRAEAVGVQPQSLLALARGEAVPDLLALSLRLVLHETAPGPVVLWLDDAHRDESSLALAAAILDAGVLREAPVLIVATLDDDALERLPGAARLVARLDARDNVRTLPLRPMSTAEMSRLIPRMLPLDLAAVPRLAEIADGSPLIATQLLGAWVQRGELIPGPSGFAVVPGAEAPRDLRAVWAGRLAPFVEQWLTSETQAVILAAVLGMHVEHAQWTAACEHQLLPAADDAIADLARAGLVRMEGRDFRFDHGLMRVALLDLADQRGLRRAFEATCAAVLPPTLHERRGRHLRASGAFEEAFEDLLTASGARVNRDNCGAALWLVEQALSCLREAAVPPDDERWGRAQIQHVYALLTDWQLERSVRDGLHFAAECERYGWEESLRAATFYVGTAAFRLYRLDEAFAQFEKMAAISLPGTVSLARALRGLGQVRQAAARYAEAEVFYRQYAEIAEATGDPFLIASSHNDLGNAAVRQGRRVEARAHFEKGLELCIRNNFKDKTIARLNVIGQMLQDRQFQESHEQALLSLDEAEDQFSVFALAAAHAIALRTSAAVGDWATWSRVAPRVRTLLSAANMVEETIGESVLKAGDDARDAGFPDRARLAWEIALEQYVALDRPEFVAELDKRLNSA